MALCVSTLWLSGSLMSLSYLSLHAESSALFGWFQSRLPRPRNAADVMSVYAAFVGVAVLYVGMLMAAYFGGSRQHASTAVIACLILCLVEAMWNPWQLSNGERYLVLLPLGLNAGLTWASFAGTQDEKALDAPGNWEAAPEV